MYYDVLTLIYDCDQITKLLHVLYIRTTIEDISQPVAVAVTLVRTHASCMMQTRVLLIVVT